MPHYRHYNVTFLPVIITFVGVIVAFIGGWLLALDEEGPRLVQKRRRLLKRYAYSQPEREAAELQLLYLTSYIDEALAVLSGSWWLHVTTSLFALMAALTTVV